MSWWGGARAARINTNAGIVAKQLYQIRAYDARRGALNASNKANTGVEPDGYLSTCGSTYTTDKGYKEYKDVSINTNSQYQQFAFIQVGSNYYLYNRGAKKLCYVDGNYVRFGTTVQTVTLTAVTTTGKTDCALIQFGTNNKFLTFSNNDNGKFAIYAQTGIQATTNDGGDALQINSIEGATLTEAELLYAQNLIDGRCNTAISNAQAALALSTETQVGYPTASQRNTLNTAITTFQNKVNNSTATNADLTTLNTAVSTYKTTMDINFPEDGKAYKIVAVHPNGKKQPLYYTGSAVGGKLESNITDIYDAYWICHKTSNAENKYLFANHNGFYLNWFCDENKGLNTTGVSTTYNADYNVWTLARATTTKSGGAIDNNVTNETFFGCFELNAKGTGTNYYYLITRYNTNGIATFHAGSANDKYYQSKNNDQSPNQNTFIYQLVEVDYYNKLKFQTPFTTDGNDYASIFLPYAATVPTGATAYYGTLNTNNSKLNLTAIQGSTIPKKTAVVLVAPSDLALGTVYVAPATEAGTRVNENALQGTVETSPTTPHITTTYVLNGGNGPIGFYEYTATNLPKGRAYFEIAKSTTNAKGYLFDFGNGETTGISNATMGNEAENTYYDLSGRRIAAPKHGLYIRNGKKVYIK